MPDIGGMLLIGKRALSAHQQAISVTSQNTANVNTEGYNRQSVVYETTSMLDGFGTGVQLQQVRSAVDRFLGLQIGSEQATLGRFLAEKGLLDRVEAVFGNLGEDGVSQSISNFFAAVNDLSDNPSGIPERTVLVERGKSLAHAFATADTRLKVIQADSNSEITSRIDEINSLASQVAGLNKQIQSAEAAGGPPANDLRSQRDGLLKALSNEIGVDVLEDPDGISLIIGSGGERVPLVSGDTAFALSTLPDPASGFSKIVYRGRTDITNTITSGRLRGLIDVQNHLIPSYIDRLDQLSAALSHEFNLQHQAGFGLDESTGVDFFSPLNEKNVFPAQNNRGTGVVTAEFEPLPDPPDPDNPPPKITFDTYQLSFNRGAFTLRNLSTGEQITTSDADEITLERVKINLTGTLKEGDQFQIKMHQGAAGAMAVELSDLQQVAASKTKEALPGGNQNAIALAQLQNKPVYSLKEATFEGFFAGFIGELGTRAQQSARNLSVQEAVTKRLDTMREEGAGVSLDEEMTNLISFQRAYQAAARLITVADELLQTVIALKS
ncbi:MAG: flagellar hook-associated protein FlgK [Nitrospirota bacterium]